MALMKQPRDWHGRTMKMSNGQRREYFWSRVEVRTAMECWPWIGKSTSQGYGLCHFVGWEHRSNRIAWLLTYGEIPKGYCVCHHCDNRACCNPIHMFLGTRADNLHDAMRKGRLKLSPLAHAKLTWPKVEEIRMTYRNEKISGPKLAKRYGLGTTTIYSIIKNESWRKKSWE